MINQEKARKFVFFGGLGLLVIGMIVIIVVSIINIVRSNIYTATLKLVVVPSSSEIIVNGTKYENGEHAVKPGDYHIEISKEGFESYSQDISVSAEKTGRVFVMLTQTDGGDWLADHPEDQALMDPIQSEYMTKSAAALAEKYPITTKLPINISFYSSNYSKYTKYSISYRTVKDGIILIITDYTGGNYDAALEKIRARGFDPKDYKIEYIEEEMGWGHAK